MKTDSMRRLMVGMLVVGALALQTPVAMAGSITMTNNVHQGTDLLPESGFALTTTGSGIVFGDFATSTSVTASASGVPSITASDAQTSSYDYSGLFATATLLPGDVMGSNAAADGVTNWIELSNFNVNATATYSNDGSYGLANAISSYDFKQAFTADGVVNYHFDYQVLKDILDPPVAGLENVFGKSTFQFFLSNGVDTVTTGLMSFTDSFYGVGDLALDFGTGANGFYKVITTADATATVPEPGTFLLLGLGLGGLAIYRRRRQVNG